MGHTSLEMGTIFLMQTGAGILGNSFLLFLYTFTLLTGKKKRPSDLILNQLVLANNLALFSRGIPHTMAAFGLKYFLDDAGCKVVLYFHRVSRGISLSTTCLLGGYQAIKLSPRTFWWMEFRNRTPKCIGFCSFLFWILQLLVNVYIPVRVISPRSSKNVTVQINYGYCFLFKPNRFMSLFHAVIFSFIDIMCLGFMVCASSSMIFILRRHKQQVQHIHSHRLSSRPFHEARATHTILILVSMFVSCYCLSAILILCVTLIANPRRWLLDTSVLVTSCFPVFSPFVLISSDSRVSQVCSVFCPRKKVLFFKYG
ncbi:vomeronasal type-1 receptor 1-like [Cynocephalus volans]|uniref:vomeronasal type-1 receptor 1-like n=1 Tax=Cynocephalus volans TaxID=110931 RepID=UPI002FC6BD74